MSNLNQFIGEPAVTSIVRSENSIQLYTPAIIASSTSTTRALSGALTANTLATALNLTGSGTLDIFAACSVDATSRTIRVVVTIDGQVTPAYDKTTAAISAADKGIVPVGATVFVPTSGASIILPEPMTFKTSCLVQIASSLSETDKIAVYYQYRKN